ncbi:MAG: hypothetical protein M0008_05360 [Actinomycetota bacterium]|nr:hypothetical protein [Actinomycetota bacterium]
MVWVPAVVVLVVFELGLIVVFFAVQVGSGRGLLARIVGSQQRKPFWKVVGVLEVLAIMAVCIGIVGLTAGTLLAGPGLMASFWIRMTFLQPSWWRYPADDIRSMPPYMERDREPELITGPDPPAPIDPFPGEREDPMLEAERRSYERHWHEVTDDLPRDDLIVSWGSESSQQEDPGERSPGPPAITP